jgi:hypothetical protein
MIITFDTEKDNLAQVQYILNSLVLVYPPHPQPQVQAVGLENGVGGATAESSNIMVTPTTPQATPTEVKPSTDTGKNLAFSSVEGGGLSLDDLKAISKELIESGGRSELAIILDQFQIQKVCDLPADKYDDYHAFVKSTIENLRKVA